MDTLDAAARRTFESAGPGYLAYIPGGGLYSAALADFLALRLEPLRGAVEAAPALVQIEENGRPVAVRPVRLPAGGAAASSRPAARWRTSPRSSPPGTARSARTSSAARLRSEQTHASIDEGGEARGVPGAGSARSPPTTTSDGPRRPARGDPRGPRRGPAAVPRRGQRRHDEHRRGRPDRRGRGGRRARKACGSTSTAAYGGFFQLTDRGRERVRRHRARRLVTLDPHKGLFLPYGTGCLLVRDGEAPARGPPRARAEYLQDLPTHEATPNFSDSRPSSRATSAASGCGCR